MEVIDEERGIDELDFDTELAPLVINQTVPYDDQYTPVIPIAASIVDDQSLTPSQRKVLVPAAWELNLRGLDSKAIGEKLTKEYSGRLGNMKIISTQQASYLVKEAAERAAATMNLTSLDEKTAEIVNMYRLVIQNLWVRMLNVPVDRNHEKANALGGTIGKLLSQIGDATGVFMNLDDKSAHDLRIQEYEMFRQVTLEVLEEVAPDVRRRIVTRIQERARSTVRPSG